MLLEYRPGCFLSMATELSHTITSSYGMAPVTILGSENCQSILFQNLLSASQLLRVCDFTLSTEALRQLQSFCLITAPHIACHLCLYGQMKHRITKLRSSQGKFLPVIYHHSLS